MKIQTKFKSPYHIRSLVALIDVNRFLTYLLTYHINPVCEITVSPCHLTIHFRENVWAAAFNTYLEINPDSIHVVLLRYD